MTSQRTLESLNAVLAVTEDGARGYQAAARAARDLSVKCYLTRAAARCRASGEVIKDAIVREGGVSYRGGSLAGALHRAGIALLGALPHTTDASILRECLRGQKTAVQAFVDALYFDPPAEVKAMLQWQLQGVEEHSAQLMHLIDATTLTKAALQPLGAD